MLHERIKKKAKQRPRINGIKRKKPKSRRGGVLKKRQQVKSSKEVLVSASPDLFRWKNQ
jgi:hypothetical protein